MFKTEAELEQFMAQEGLTRNPETGYIENEYGMVNPYSLSYLNEAGEWCTLVGVHFNIHEAYNRLSKLINSGEHRTILIARANDLEKYSKVYVPGEGIIDYTKWKNDNR